MADIEQKVVVVDIRMKFWSMVVLMVKLAIAAIPAAFILALLVAALTAVFPLLSLLFKSVSVVS